MPKPEAAIHTVAENVLPLAATASTSAWPRGVSDGTSAMNWVGKLPKDVCEARIVISRASAAPGARKRNVTLSSGERLGNGRYSPVMLISHIDPGAKPVSGVRSE